jgi:hypothetical protein
MAWDQVHTVTNCMTDRAADVDCVPHIIARSPKLGPPESYVHAVWFAAKEDEPIEYYDELERIALVHSLHKEVP